ncbi:MAG: type II toxin-antitoxin system RelB/DinJ family antitoxin [Eggerthellaceae bacterium]|nr:type II toxin-antitoxin system RelB/DinJ family antitoxin [Eggerthellaceae bacterium]
MMKSTTIRMDDDLKKQATAKLEALGLSFNTFVVMATVQLVSQDRVPFDLVVPDSSPGVSGDRGIA